MKASRLAVLSVLFSLLSASAAFAADDGNTKPRLSSAAVTYNPQSAGLIYQTSVSGNVKGVSCSFVNGAYGNVNFYVDSDTPQTITVSGQFSDSSGRTYTGWIPMNIRFNSFIYVEVHHAGPNGEVACQVSWALD